MNISVKILCFVCFLVLGQLAYSQNYINYYQQINTAKVQIANQEYQAAVSSYHRAFENYDFIFARDCIHAAEVSAHTVQNNMTAYFVKRALEAGVPLSYFKSQIKFVRFRNCQYWSEILNEAPYLQQVYQHKINHSLRAEINEMFSADQEIRTKFYKWSNFLFRPFIAMQWQKLNHQQVQRLIEITHKHGFPGEQLIGIDLSSHHQKIAAHQFSAGMPIILLIHHYSQPNPSYDSLLFEAVKKGMLYNLHFATICDFEAKFGKKKYPNFGYYGLKQQPKHNQPSAFNAKRAQLGLLTDAELKQLNQSKILTQFWHQLK